MVGQAWFLMGKLFTPQFIASVPLFLKEVFSLHKPLQIICKIFESKG